MNAIRRLSILLVALLLCFGFVSASAATITQDNLTVTLITDKASYAEGDTIQTSLKISNNNDFSIENVSLTYELPGVCVPQGGTASSLSIPSLNANTSKSFSASFSVINKARLNASLPSTGDGSHMILWLALAALSIAGFLRLKARARRQLSALLLCVVTAGSVFFAGGVISANADAKEASILRVSETVTIAGKEAKIAVVIRYTDFASAHSSKDASKAVQAKYAGKSLADILDETTLTLVYDKEYTPGMTLPASPHPYADNTALLYSVYAQNCAAITFTFDGSCETENNYDYVYVFDAKGNQVARYTGTQMRNKTLTIAGNRIYIAIISDYSINKYGFGLSGMQIVNSPEMISCYNNGSGAVVLKWTSHDKCTGYQVQRAIVSADGTPGKYTTLKTGTNATSYTDTTCKLGYRYNYRVRQYAKLGSTTYYTGFDDETIYVFNTTSITNAAATTVGSSPAVSLTWKPVTNGSRYEIYRSETKTGTYTKVGETASTSYTTILPAKQIYYYKVRPYATVRGEEYVTFYSDPKACGYASTPTGLSAYGAGSKSVILTWNQSSGVYGYVVYRSASLNGAYTKIGETTSALKLTDTSAKAGKVNYYKIRSYIKVNGNRVYSDYSDAVGVYPMAKVTGLKGTRNSNTSVTLQWKAVSGAQKYAVYYGYSKSGPFTQAGTTDSTSYTVTNLSDSYEYVYFQIRAQRSDGTYSSLTSVNNTVKVKTNPQVLRAFYVIEDDFPGSSSDFPNEYENNTVLLSKMFKKATPGKLTLAAKFPYRNQTQSQLINRINTMAGYADANDITFFYLTCHGLYDRWAGAYTNEIYLSDGSSMHVSTLAQQLKTIPGRVVVILDYCGSGLAINKSAGTNPTAAYEQFSKDIINAFAAEDSQITYRSNDDDPNLSKNGEFCVSNKFFVITGARGTEASWSNTARGYGSYLLQWMNDGIMAADTDKNNTVTLKEMGAYLNKRGSSKAFWDGTAYVHMIPQVYPENSSFGLFVKK